MVLAKYRTSVMLTIVSWLRGKLRFKNSSHTLRLMSVFETPQNILTHGQPLNISVVKRFLLYKRKFYPSFYLFTIHTLVRSSLNHFYIRGTRCGPKAHSSICKKSETKFGQNFGHYLQWIPATATNKVLKQNIRRFRGNGSQAAGSIKDQNRVVLSC